MISDKLEEDPESEAGKMLALAIEVLSLLLTELNEEQEGADEQLVWARSFTSSFSSGRYILHRYLLEVYEKGILCTL